MILGYARVSTKEQNLDMQIDKLREAGVEKIYHEKISGAYKERPELNRLLENLRPGDTLIVYKLDRLGRTIEQLIKMVNSLNDNNINFISVQDNIDTTTSHGKFIFHIFCAMAEMERNLIRERTKAGLEAARKRGRKGGRKKVDESTIKKAITMYNSKEFTINEIIKDCNISKSVFYKYLKHNKT